MNQIKKNLVDYLYYETGRVLQEYNTEEVSIKEITTSATLLNNVSMLERAIIGVGTQFEKVPTQAELLKILSNLLYILVNSK